MAFCEPWRKMLPIIIWVRKRFFDRSETGTEKRRKRRKSDLAADEKTPKIPKKLAPFCH